MAHAGPRARTRGRPAKPNSRPPPHDGMDCDSWPVCRGVMEVTASVDCWRAWAPTTCGAKAPTVVSAAPTGRRERPRRYSSHGPLEVPSGGL